MIRKAFFWLTAIALIAPSAAGLAQSVRQTPGSHIAVLSCDPHRHRAGTAGHPWIDPYGNYHPDVGFPYTVGFLGVTYKNEARVAAKEIVFGLVARDSLVAIAKDVGTFSPGTTIDHEFSLDPEVFPLGTSLPYCAVLSVKYADGTVWKNPRTVD